MAGGIADLNVRVGANIAAFEAGMSKLEKSLNRVGSRFQSIGKSLTTSLTLPLGALGGLAVKTFADFELAMAKVQGVSGATAEQFKALKKNAEDLGASTKFTAAQVAGLQLELAKLGLKPDQIVQSTDAILALAQAFDYDLAEAAATAAKTMNAFGLQAKDMAHITDVMAKSFSSSALDMEYFGDAMQYAGAAGKASGKSLEEVTAMMGVLADSGIAASGAGTALRRMFIVAAEKGRDLNDILKEINGSQNKLQAASAIFGKTAANQALILAENAEKVDLLSAAFRVADGTAKNMQKTMDETLAGGFARMKSALEAAAITIGQILAPYVSKLATWLGELAMAFRDLDPRTQKMILAIAGIAAAIGPLLFIMGKLMSATAVMSKGFSGLFSLLFKNPWTLIIAGIAGVVMAVIDLTGRLDENRRATEAYNNISKRTSELAGDQMAKLRVLTATFNDAKSSLDQKKAAYAELISLYPTYFKNLKFEDALQQGITKQTLAAANAIQQKAKMAAMEEELVKLYKEQFKIQEDIKKQGAEGGTGDVPWYMDLAMLTPASGAIAGINNHLKETTGYNLGQAASLGELNQTNKAIEAITASLVEQKQAVDEIMLVEQKDFDWNKFGSALNTAKGVTTPSAGGAIDSGGGSDNAAKKAEEKIKSQGEIEAEAIKKAEEYKNEQRKRAQEKSDREIEKLNEAHADKINQLEWDKINGVITTDQQFKMKQLALEMERLETLKATQEKYGFSSVETERQISDLKIQIAKAEKEAQAAATAEALAKQQELSQKRKDNLNGVLGAAQTFSQSLLDIEANIKDTKLRRIDEEIEAQRVAIEAKKAADQNYEAEQAALSELEAKRKSEAAQRSKGLALFNIAANTAQGISGAIAAGAGLIFPANLAAIASGIGAVISGSLQAKNVLSGAPAFAEGGMVTAPMMAMVGDNPSGKEAIIPFEKMGKFVNMVAGGGGGGSYPERIILTARGEDLQAVLSKADRTKRRTT